MKDAYFMMIIFVIKVEKQWRIFYPSFFLTYYVANGNIAISNIKEDERWNILF